MTNRKFSRLEKRFNSIAQKLTRFDLQRLGSSDKASFSIHDVIADLHNHSGTSLFMGFYTTAGLMEALEKYGIVVVLRKKGFRDLRLRIDTDNPFRHVFQLYWKKEGDPGKLLGEAILHEAVVTPKTQTAFAENHDVLFIEWLCLQNPRDEFTAERPRLPGQEKPGLGIAMEVVGLLAAMAKRLKKDGLLNIPQYYHSAKMAQDIGFLFFDPATEGSFRALSKCLHGRSIAEGSWAIEQGLVTRQPGGESFVWAGEEQMLAVSERAKEYFVTKAYAGLCASEERRSKFRVDWNGLQIAPEQAIE